MTADLAHHGVKPNSVDECVDCLFSEIPSDEAKELLRHLLEKEQQYDDFSTMAAVNGSDVPPVDVQSDRLFDNVVTQPGEEEAKLETNYQTKNPPGANGSIALGRSSNLRWP